MTPTVDYSANTCCVEIGNYTLWYSYKTLIAFNVPGHPRVVCENVWTKMTGKHLNEIDGGTQKERVDKATFDRLVRELLLPCFITAVQNKA